jgi:hypothetical protein
LLWSVWPEVKGKKVFGFALIDPFCWPVTFRLFGRSRDCYRWPYYFSRSSKRTIAAEKLSGIFAAKADHIIEKYKMAVAIICMESIDDAFAEITLKKIKNKKWVRIFSSSSYNASQITSVLRSLRYLISMRYHACVLSMACGVPMIGIAHDLRIPDLFGELGLKEFCFTYDKITLSLLSKLLDRLMSQGSNFHELVLASYKSQLARAKRNRKLLANFLAKFDS